MPWKDGIDLYNQYKATVQKGGTTFLGETRGENQGSTLLQRDGSVHQGKASEDNCLSLIHI